MSTIQYNGKTDDFTMTVSPEDLATIQIWLKEARGGIATRLDRNLAPADAEAKRVHLSVLLTLIEDAVYERDLNHARTQRTAA